MKKRRVWQAGKSVISVLLAFMISIVLSGDTRVLADGTEPYRITINSGARNLGEIEPGENYTGGFKISNDGTEKFRFKVSFAPYSIVNDEYQLNFTDFTTYNEIAKWISADIDEMELDAGDNVTLNWMVDVPSDAHGGAQMGAILITMDPIEQPTDGIIASRQLAYLIYGNVDGEITKTAKILENKVPSFLFNPPITATSIVENTGNVYTKAQYTLQVFPLFSDEEVYTNEEKPEDSVIYPETSRMKQLSWEGAPQLGIFKVRSTVKIFDEESVTEKIVFLCPIWFLFIVLLLIFCIIFWLVSRIFKRRKEA